MEETNGFESPLHAELGLTDEAMRAQLILEGLNPIIETSALRAMILIHVARAIELPENLKRVAKLLVRNR
jgi:hypothetical protein